MTVDVIQEACHNFSPVVGRKYSIAVARKVWDAVGKWIEQYICKHKAVIVPGLGTFTLSEWALDTGLGKPLILSKPAFFLAENLLYSYNVRQRQVYASQRLSCHMIHYGGVASLAGFDTATVKVCIQEVIQALRRLLWKGHDLHLSLMDLGTLRVSNSLVEMQFSHKLESKVRALTEKRRLTPRPVHPWSPKKILP